MKPESAVVFVLEDVNFTLANKRKLKAWLMECCAREKKDLGELTYIFCSDKYLLKINRKYLNHDYLTDVITFDNSVGGEVGGDVFISCDRVKDNAKIFKQRTVDEAHRIMVHGLLHLLGYGDKKPEQQKVMKAKEDFYLSLRAF